MKALATQLVWIAGMLFLTACGGGPAASGPMLAQTQSRTAASFAASFAGDEPAARTNARRVCAQSAEANVMACLAMVRTDVPASSLGEGAGYGPSQLESAYNFPSSTAGSGQTIAVVDAFDDPDAESDLATYRAYYALPACGSSTGCFVKVNQDGQARPLPRAAGNSGWDLEESLDVQMISAICPNCKIILVEANAPTIKDLGSGVAAAIALGANVVSNSYSGNGTSGARYYDHPGTIITASAGDDGYSAAIPAGFPTVVSVGGTDLRKARNSRGWNETVWSGTGSGCEATFRKPKWQTDTGCKGRTMNDVAADAGTPVAVYDSYSYGGFVGVEGTSVSSPIVAAAYGLAGNAGSLDAARSLYASGAPLFDVTKGQNGSCRPTYLCHAELGYDGPTGTGTPDGVGAL